MKTFYQRNGNFRLKITFMSFKIQTLFKLPILRSDFVLKDPNYFYLTGDNSEGLKSFSNKLELTKSSKMNVKILPDISFLQKYVPDSIFFKRGMF